MESKPVPIKTERFFQIIYADRNKSNSWIHVHARYKVDLGSIQSPSLPPSEPSDQPPSASTLSSRVPLWKISRTARTRQASTDYPFQSCSRSIFASRLDCPAYQQPRTSGPESPRNYGERI
jgi:hypothetical protein